MVALNVILDFSLLVLLPQLAGLLVTRLVRRPTWVAWPAAAIAVFGVVFYWFLWVPAGHEPCGTWQVALGHILLPCLLTHLGAGILLGLLARRLRRSARP